MKSSIKEREPALRDRIVEAASKVFVEDGYDALSMRRVAQDVGCSQMAMYRHFANKDALIQYICSELYVRFATKMYREIAEADDAWGQLRQFIAALIGFATTYPEHYSLIFLVRHSDPVVLEDRERMGREFIRGMRPIVRSVLPKATPARTVDTKLRQMLSCLHGTAALLIAHPKAYGLTKKKAIEDAESTFRCVLGL